MTTDATYQHLAALRAALGDLDDALTPGTPRRWAEHDLTPTQRARQDAQALAERHDKELNLAHGIKALGTGRAPLRLDVLDAATDITAALVELEDAVCDRLGLTPKAGATPAARITRLVGLLDRITHHDDLADHVHAEAARLHRRATRALGDAEPVLKVNAPCPLCDRYALKAFPERGLIICVSSECRCDTHTCRCWNRPRPGIHRWYENEWKKLAHDLDTAV